MKKISFFLALVLSSLSLFAQKNKRPDINKLPNYVIVAADASPGLLGGLGISIDTKNSEYKDQFDNLEDFLTSKKEGAGVRNLTDLLNTMYELGYEYVNAFEASSFGIGAESVTASSRSEKARASIVFKKTNIRSVFLL